jgi:hypothetical protein
MFVLVERLDGKRGTETAGEFEFKRKRPLG